MSGEGLKVAFCVVLWKAHGGGFLPSGEPDFSGDSVRGNCTEAYDCRDCAILQAELVGVRHSWVCGPCVEELSGQAERDGLIPKDPGYYTEGPCENPLCWYYRQNGEARFSILNRLLVVL